MALARLEVLLTWYKERLDRPNVHPESAGYFKGKIRLLNEAKALVLEYLEEL